jgi:hypothetical protein
MNKGVICIFKSHVIIVTYLEWNHSHSLHGQKTFLTLERKLSTDFKLNELMYKLLDLSMLFFK